MNKISQSKNEIENIKTKPQKMFDIENHNYNFSFITYDKIN